MSCLTSASRPAGHAARTSHDGGRAVTWVESGRVTLKSQSSRRAGARPTGDRWHERWRDGAVCCCLERGRPRARRRMPRNRQRDRATAWRRTTVVGDELRAPTGQPRRTPPPVIVSDAMGWLPFSCAAASRRRGSDAARASRRTLLCPTAATVTDAGTVAAALPVERVTTEPPGGAQGCIGEPAWRSRRQRPSHTVRCGKGTARQRPRGRCSRPWNEPAAEAR